MRLSRRQVALPALPGSAARRPPKIKPTLTMTCDGETCRRLWWESVPGPRGPERGSGRKCFSGGRRRRAGKDLRVSRRASRSRRRTRPDRAGKVATSGEACIGRTMIARPRWNAMSAGSTSPCSTSMAAMRP
jgi:hypothetical protein